MRCDGRCSFEATGLARRRDRWEERDGREEERRACPMARTSVLFWAVCVLRVAQATVYFQEEFMDGGEEAVPAVAGP